MDTNGFQDLAGYTLLHVALDTQLAIYCELCVYLSEIERECTLIVCQKVGLF